MAWEEVEIKVDDLILKGYMKGNDLNIPNQLELGDSIRVKNKDYMIASYEVDERDDILMIKLADASPKKGAKNGKSPKGSDQNKPSE